MILTIVTLKSWCSPPFVSLSCMRVYDCLMCLFLGCDFAAKRFRVAICHLIEFYLDMTAADFQKSPIPLLAYTKNT